MLTLVIQIVWHGLIGALIFWNSIDNRVTPTNRFVHIDIIVFFTIVALFIIGHLALIIWLHMVPLKYRKEMDRRGFQFEELLSSKRKRQAIIARKASEKFSSAFVRIPTEN
jgi:hypothetical protein